MAGLNINRKSFISLWEKTFQTREFLESDLADLRAFFLSLRAGADASARTSAALQGSTPPVADPGQTQRPPTAPPPRTESDGDGGTAQSSAVVPAGTATANAASFAASQSGRASVVVGEVANGKLLIGGASGRPMEGPTEHIAQIDLAGGADYELTADDGLAPGHVLIIDASWLGAANRAAFNGSAESDGSFVFKGGDSADRFTGGGGMDVIYGGGGADILAGGGNMDVFVYGSASESSGAGYDTLVDLDFAEDVVDLPTEVSGFDPSVAGRALSTATFDSDLAAALDGRLGVGRAVLFTADSGDLSGKTFLIVDANGEAGYQAGEDFVFLLGSTPADPITDPGLFA